MGPNGNGAGRQFRDVITTEAALRAIIGEASDLVWNKVISHVDAHCRQFIAKSPFLLVSSSLLRRAVSGQNPRCAAHRVVEGLVEADAANLPMIGMAF